MASVKVFSKEVTADSAANLEMQQQFLGSTLSRPIFGFDPI